VGSVLGVHTLNALVNVLLKKDIEPIEAAEALTSPLPLPLRSGGEG